MQARYQLPITSPGAILREERKLATPLGIEAEKATSQGQLVADSIVNAVVKNWLTRHDSAFVFDGYPRSLGQATALDEMLAERDTPLEVVLSLEADFETIRGRVERRLMCSACGRIVSIGLHVSSMDAPCPACGGTLTRRRDDTAETLAIRMREYEEKTAPLIDYYHRRGLLHSVDSRGTPEVVCSLIAEILEDR
jgi:adenylate kinase